MMSAKQQTEQSQWRIKHPVLWRVIWCVFSLCALIIFIFCAIFVLLNMQVGKNYLISQIQQRTHDHIQIKGLSGFFPSNLNIEQIQFKNTDVGVWAEIKGAHLKWSPLALFSNKITVQSFVAKEVDFYNLPPQNVNKDTALPTIGHRLIGLPWQVDIQYLHIDQLLISEQIAKRNLSVDIEGTVHIRDLSKIMDVTTLKTAFMTNPKFQLIAVKQSADFMFSGKIGGSIERKDGKEYALPLVPLHFSVMLPEYPKPNSNNDLRIYFGLGKEI